MSLSIDKVVVVQCARVEVQIQLIIISLTTRIKWKPPTLGVNLISF